jgi:hypothetical protein
MSVSEGALGNDLDALALLNNVFLYQESRLVLKSSNLPNTLLVMPDTKSYDVKTFLKRVGIIVRRNLNPGRQDFESLYFNSVWRVGPRKNKSRAKSALPLFF